MHSRLILLIVAFLFAISVHAEEGFWLFENPPTQYLQEHYNFTPTPAWSQHIQQSVVKVEGGHLATGFFVTPSLLLTNWHVVGDCVRALSTEQNNYYKDSFYADRPSKELRCPGFSIRVLLSIDPSIDSAVKAAVQGLDPAEAFAARKAKMAELEKPCTDPTQNKVCEVVELYGGGAYHLYQYKVYDDIRLVFSAEQATAFFGGDWANFNYPRTALDVAFIRAYENGKLAQNPHWLRWGSGAREGDLLLVVGNPGGSNRLITPAEAIRLRDQQTPFLLTYHRNSEIALQQYGLRGQQEQEKAAEQLLTAQNYRKVYAGRMESTFSASFLERVRHNEQTLKEFAQTHSPQALEAWDIIAQTEEKNWQLYVELSLFETGRAFNSDLFSIGRHLIRMAEEDPKPNNDRLREYRSTARKRLEQQVFSETRLYPDLEQTKLAASLSFMAEQLSGDHPLVQLVLAGKSPQARAYELTQTQLYRLDYRKQLAAGGQAAINECQDPMITLAKAIDLGARKLRKKVEEEIQEPQTQAKSKIKEVYQALHVQAIYPDATGTLRFAFGTIRGYEEGGVPLAPFTNLQDAFRQEALHGGQPPWRLPPRWQAAKSKLTGKTPFNFVVSADLIGGMSGSPLIDRAGEVQGIAFDTNLAGTAWYFQYEESQGRAIAVDIRAIQLLTKVYKVNFLSELNHPDGCSPSHYR